MNYSGGWREAHWRGSVLSLLAAAKLTSAALFLTAVTAVFPSRIAESASVVFGQGCDKFASANNLREVTITDEGPAPEPPASNDPAMDVRIIYPVDYLASPFPFGLPPQARQTGESFLIRLSDGGAIPWQDRYDSNGLAIPSRELPPHATVLLHDRYNIERVIAVTVSSALFEKTSFTLPTLDLEPSEFDDLLEVKGERRPWAQGERQFLVRSGDRYTDLITCRLAERVPFPHCEHLFDYRNLDVDIHYRLSELAAWREVKKRVTDFLACAYIEDISAKTTDGDTIWD